MTDPTNPRSNDTVTGRYYTNGKINISTKTAKTVPWAHGTQIVTNYDPKTDELRIKRLKY